MADAERRVFISYRRRDRYFARCIYQALLGRGYDVFLDVDTMGNGKFNPMIYKQIAARPHFLILLVPGALKRCINPDDPVRQEIESAIDLRRNIVPIMDEEFHFEEEQDYLIGKLKQLSSFNGF